MRKRRFRSFDTEELMLDPLNKKLGGVCAGVARYFDWPRFYIRAAAVAALLIIPQAALLGYGLAYLILDDRPTYDDMIDD